MTLPPAIADKVIDATAKELAAEMRPDLNELELVTYKRAAELLKVSQSTARRVIAEYVELGESTRRVRLSTLRAMIEGKTFRSGKGARNKASGGLGAAAGRPR